MMPVPAVYLATRVACTLGLSIYGSLIQGLPVIVSVCLNFPTSYTVCIKNILYIHRIFFVINPIYCFPTITFGVRCGTFQTSDHVYRVRRMYPYSLKVPLASMFLGPWYQARGEAAQRP